MTPKEKADELVEKFNSVDRCVEHYDTSLDGNMCNHMAIQCAIIAVEEIQITNEVGYVTYTYAKAKDMIKERKYWQSVLSELRTLA